MLIDRIYFLSFLFVEYRYILSASIKNNIRYVLFIGRYLGECT